MYSARLINQSCEKAAVYNQGPVEPSKIEVVPLYSRQLSNKALLLDGIEGKFAVII